MAAYLRCSKDEHPPLIIAATKQGTVGAVALISKASSSPPLPPEAPAANSPAVSVISPLIGCGCTPTRRLAAFPAPVTAKPS